jgi:tRNA(Ile)-lysidine synthase
MKQHKLLQHIDQVLRQDVGISPGSRLLVACSAGLDSTVLLHALHELGYNCHVVHAQFSLRDQDSEADEQSVRKMAESLGLPLTICPIDIKSERSPTESLQMAARRLRFEAFEDVRRQGGCEFIALAHHMDDQAETVLMRWMRGSGIEGLSGIRPKSGSRLHPLLGLRKSELKAWAEDRKVSWREDRSNQEPLYHRNRIRQQLIPALEELEPSAVPLIAESAGHLQEAAALARIGQSRLLKQISLPAPEGLKRISISALLRSGAAATLLRAWLSETGFDRLEQQNILQSLKAGIESGKHWDAGMFHLYVERRSLLLIPEELAERDQPPTILIGPERTNLSTPDYKLRIQAEQGSRKGSIPSQDKGVLINADKLEYPLILRPWRAGDYLYPFGLNKKKKVQKILTEAQVPKHLRNQCMVLCSGSRIIWLLGYCLDHRFRVRPDTPRLLRISLESRP